MPKLGTVELVGTGLLGKTSFLLVSGVGETSSPAGFKLARPGTVNATVKKKFTAHEHVMGV